MTSTLKSALLASAAGLLGLGLSSPALAFDGVSWNWDKQVNETVTVDTTLTTDLAPTGLVQLEKMQIYIGDATATSEVTGVNNIQPTNPEAGTADFTVSWSGNYTDPVNHPFGTAEGGAPATLGGDLTGNGTIEGNLSEDQNHLNFTATFDDIPVSVSASDVYPAATELPQVVSAATAVGNLQSISSDVGVSEHAAQFVFGGYNPVTSLPPMGNITLNDVTNFISTGNTSLSSALVFALAGAAGVITPANIEATSTVSDITNATVDSNATALANSASIDVAAATAGDQYVMADYMQGALANVSASSSVSGVTLNHYSGLGSLDRPIVNSSATAVGNNLSIKVSAPVVAGP